MKIINVVGDSLSMVRPEESIYLEDLFWYHMQRELGGEFYVINNSRRSNDFKLTAKNADDEIFNRRAHSIIFFLGIVDCFPRLFGPREHLILSMLPEFGLGKVTGVITKLASRNRLFMTKHFKKVYLTPAEVEAILHLTFQRIEREKAARYVYLLGVLHTNDATRVRNHGVDDNIETYNRIYQKVAGQYPQLVRYVDLNTRLTANDFIPILDDGHHISKEAHKRLAHILLEEIQQAESANVNTFE